MKWARVLVASQHSAFTQDERAGSDPRQTDQRAVMPETAENFADILRRLENGDKRFTAIEAAQKVAAAAHAASAEQSQANAVTLEEIKKLVAPIPDLTKKVTATKEIVELWNAAKTGGKFLKWCAGVLGALTIILVALKTVGSAWIEWGHPKP